MKTPITASKLLLERNEDNVVNRVRQEIIQIDNYTSLALSYLKIDEPGNGYVLFKSED